MALSPGDLVFVRRGPPAGTGGIEFGVIIKAPYKMPVVGTIVDVWVGGELRHILREAIAQVHAKCGV
jgi:hypothetical protein